MHRQANALQQVIEVADGPRRTWRFAIAALCVAWLSGPLIAQDLPPTVEYAELFEQLPIVPTPAEPNDASSENITLNVRGRVLDDAEQPIAGAVVVLSRGTNALARTHCNDDGAYRFEDIRLPRPETRPGGNQPVTIATVSAADNQGRMNWASVELRVPSSRTERARYSFLDDEPIWHPVARKCDLTLNATSAVAGVALDARDQPAAGVSVELMALYHFTRPGNLGYANLAPSIGRLTTTSDAEGKFNFPHVPSGLVVVLALDDPEHYTTVVNVGSSPDVTSLPPGYNPFASLEPFTISPARVHLVERAILNGQLVNRNGEPLPGGIIQSRFQNHQNFPNDPKTTSDAQGKFTTQIPAPWVESFGNGSTTSPLIVVWSDDSPYATSYPELSRQQMRDHELLRIIAEDVIEIRGQVVASDDLQPVPDLPLKIERWKSGLPPTIETQTDHDGRFTAKAQAGRWLVTCGPKTGFDLLSDNQKARRNMDIDPNSQRIVDLIDPGQTVSMGIIIDRTPPVAVHVVDGDGQPVAGAKVSFLPKQKMRYVDFTPQSKDSQIVPDGITDDQGECRFHVPTLLDDDWIVNAQSPTELPRMFAAVEMRSSRSGRVDLTLVPGLPIRGRVMLNGSPLANAMAALTTASTGTQRDASEWISTVQTNDAGEYELFAPVMSNRPPGIQFESRYTVALVEIPESTTCPKASVGITNKLPKDMTGDAYKVKDFEVFSAKGEASGRVVDESGEPIADAIVRANPMVRLFSDVTKQCYAITNESGTFHWTGVGPGKFQPIVVVNGRPMSPEISIEAGQDDVEIVVPNK